MATAPIYVFDAYGTLFDVHSAVARHAARVGASSDRMSEIWRTKQLEYTWVYASIGRPATFWSLTEQALDFSIAASGADVDDALRADLLDAYRELAPYPEVTGVLQQLKADGARLAILSNGDPELLERAIDSAGLAGLFDHVLSVASTGTFKPSPLVYRLAVDAFDSLPSAMTFCSSNRWDIAGAQAFGFETVWVNRLARPDEYAGMPPAHTMTNLSGLLTLADGWKG